MATLFWWSGISLFTINLFYEDIAFTSQVMTPETWLPKMTEKVASLAPIFNLQYLGYFTSYTNKTFMSLKLGRSSSLSIYFMKISSLLQKLWPLKGDYSKWPKKCSVWAPVFNLPYLRYFRSYTNKSSMDLKLERSSSQLSQFNFGVVNQKQRCVMTKNMPLKIKTSQISYINNTFRFLGIF